MPLRSLNELMPGLPTIMSLPLEKSVSTMHVLGLPVEPVTIASPLVHVTASTLPADSASMLGRYSIQTNCTSTPASLKKPFWIATSHATQPGQSL